MQVNRGKVHKYIGVKLDYTTVDQVKITMLYYINEIIDAFYKLDPTGVVTKSSAAPAILFIVNKYCKKLIPNKLCSFIAFWKNIICYKECQVGHMHCNFITCHNSERNLQ